MKNQINSWEVFNADGDFLGTVKCVGKEFVTVSNKECGFEFDVKLERIKFNGKKVIVSDREE